MARLQYFYAVKKGRVPGIYQTWYDCQIQILNYPGAIFRKFSSYEHALLYYNEPITKAPIIQAHYDLLAHNYDQVIEQLEQHQVVVFVDGSYTATSAKFSYGIVLLVLDQGLVHIWTKYQGLVYSKFAQAHNVAGEVCGVIGALKYVQQYYVQSPIHIYHDYQGIGAWADKSWRANHPVAVWYQKQLAKFDYLSVSFHKVKAHSNCVLNDLADQCAKSGLHQSQKWKLVRVCTISKLKHWLGVL